MGTSGSARWHWWEEAFARQDDLLARQFDETFSQGFLGLAFGVDIRGVEEVDAEVESAMPRESSLT